MTATIGLENDVHVDAGHMSAIYWESDKGQEWMKDNVNDGNGNPETGYPVWSDSQDYIMNIVEGMLEDGLIVTMTTQSGDYCQASLHEDEHGDTQVLFALIAE